MKTASKGGFLVVAASPLIFILSATPTLVLCARVPTREACNGLSLNIKCWKSVEKLQIHVGKMSKSQ